MNAAAKRKGSFKKWLRSSHRKLTSNSTQRSSKETNGGVPKLINTDLESLKLKAKNTLYIFNIIHLKCCHQNFMIEIINDETKRS